MAVLDFVASPFETTPVFGANRGDIGSMLDIQAADGVQKYFLVVPLVDTVLLGTKYGNQGTSLTGTLAPGAGGPTYYSY